MFLTSSLISLVSMLLGLLEYCKGMEALLLILCTAEGWDSVRWCSMTCESYRDYYYCARRDVRPETGAGR